MRTQATVGNSAITVAAADIVAPTPKSYAWVAVDATCPSACGQSASTPAKTVTCKEDGATTVADSECTAKLGAAPTPTTACPATMVCLSPEPSTVSLKGGAVQATSTAALLFVGVMLAM